MSRVVQQPKKLSEVKQYFWDFSSYLQTSETISAQVVTATVYSGTDTSPSSLINGVATLSGNIVAQSLTGGVVGVMYNLQCKVTTSFSNTLVLNSFIVVEPDLT